MAADVEADGVRERGAEGRRVQNVGEEVAEFTGAFADAAHRGGLLEDVVAVADVVDAGAGRGDDVVVRREDVHVVPVGGEGVAFAAGVGHRLAAAGLCEGDVHGYAEAFQERERGAGHLGPELVHEAGDEEGDVHGGA
jgi:hypothetical protein